MHVYAHRPCTPLVWYCTVEVVPAATFLHVQGSLTACVLLHHCCLLSLQVLSAKKIGIVAHFYMDPQVQGVLSSAAQRWPHIHISDSLVMADRAVKMVEEGCTTVAVLGVDFMSENVRAILNEAGHQDAKVRFAALHSGTHWALNVGLATKAVV